MFVRLPGLHVHTVVTVLYSLVGSLLEISLCNAEIISSLSFASAWYALESWRLVAMFVQRADTVLSTDSLL